MAAGDGADVGKYDGADDDTDGCGDLCALDGADVGWRDGADDGTCDGANDVGRPQAMAPMSADMTRADDMHDMGIYLWRDILVFCRTGC